MALAAGVTVWSAVRVGSGATLAVLGAASTLLIGVAVVAGSSRLLAGAVAGLVGVGAVAVLARPTAAAILVGLTAFAVAESAFGALQHGPTGAVAVDPRIEASRWRFVAVVAVLAVLVGGTAILARHAVAGGHLGVEVLGVAAACAVAGLVVMLARREAPPTRG